MDRFSMKILFFSHESLYPVFGGHREYLEAFLNALVSDGHECTVISWGTEQDYVVDQGNLHLMHFCSDTVPKKIDFKSRQPDYNSPITYAASMLGASQYLALKNNSPDKKIEKFLLNLKDFDLILKNGPNASKIPIRASLESGVPLIDRLDWFGLPRTLPNRSKWMAYSGQRVCANDVLNLRLTFFFDRVIKKRELSSITSKYVYTPTIVDYNEIIKMDKEIEADYVFPFLNEYKAEDKNIGNVPEDFCFYFASKTFSSLLTIKYLNRVTLEHENLNVIITGNFEDIIATYNRPNFKIIGKVSLDVFWAHLRNARFVVFPSLEGHGVQMRLIRALSLGKPIIATSAICSSFTGLIDGENILIRDTPGGFERAMLELNSDENLRNKLSENAKKYFITDLDKRNSMNRFYVMVKKVVNEGPAYYQKRLSSSFKR